MSIENMKINNLYSFSTHAPTVLGKDHTRMRLIAIGDYRMASMLSNVSVRFSNILAVIPAGVEIIKDLNKERFLVFSNEAGAIDIFGYSWINQTTVETSTTQSLIMTIEGASATDANRIKEMLALAGFNKVSYRIEQSGF